MTKYKNISIFVAVMAIVFASCERDLLTEQKNVQVQSFGFQSTNFDETGHLHNLGLDHVLNRMQEFDIRLFLQDFSMHYAISHFALEFVTMMGFPEAALIEEQSECFDFSMKINSLMPQLFSRLINQHLSTDLHIVSFQEMRDMIDFDPYQFLMTYENHFQMVQHIFDVISQDPLYWLESTFPEKADFFQKGFPCGSGCQQCLGNLVELSGNAHFFSAQLMHFFSEFSYIEQVADIKDRFRRMEIPLEDAMAEYNMNYNSFDRNRLNQTMDAFVRVLHFFHYEAAQHDFWMLSISEHEYTLLRSMASVGQHSLDYWFHDMEKWGVLLNSELEHYANREDIIQASSANWGEVALADVMGFVGGFFRGGGSWAGGLFASVVASGMAYVALAEYSVFDILDPWSPHFMHPSWHMDSEYTPYYNRLRAMWERNPEHLFFIPGGRFHDHAIIFFPYD